MKLEHLKLYRDVALLLVRFGRADLVRQSGLAAEFGEPVPEPAADNVLASDVAFDAGSEYAVVAGVMMTNCGDHGKPQRFVIQIASRFRAPDASAAALCSVLCNVHCLIRRTAGKHAPDLVRHSLHQLAIFFMTAECGACASLRALIRIFHAFVFGLL